MVSYSEKPCHQCDGTGVFAQNLPCLRCDGTGLVYTRDLLQTKSAIDARERNRRKSDGKRAAKVELTGGWSAEHADVIDKIYRQQDNEFMALMRDYFERKGILTAAQVAAVRRG